MNGDVLWTWSFPSVSDTDREFFTQRSHLSTPDTTVPFLYSQRDRSWYYILSSVVDDTDQLHKVRRGQGLRYQMSQVQTPAKAYHCLIVYTVIYCKILLFSYAYVSQIQAYFPEVRDDDWNAVYCKHNISVLFLPKICLGCMI